MKAMSTINGKVSIILIPEHEGDEYIIKMLAKGATITGISPGSNTQVLETPVSKGLLIQESGKIADVILSKERE